MSKSPTPKQMVMLAEPNARCDFYELLRGAGKPCWFIRVGWQGIPISGISTTPRQAWKSAYKSLLASFERAAKRQHRRSA